MKNFFAELKRRNVHKATIIYAVIAWLLIQVAFVPVFEVPGWAIKTLIVLLILGFVAVVFISWAFEATPEGMKRTEELSPNEVLPTWSRKKLPSSSSLSHCWPRVCWRSIFYRASHPHRRLPQQRSINREAPVAIGYPLSSAVVLSQ